LPVDVQHLLHLHVKLGVAALQIILDLMRLHGLRAQNLGNRSARQVLQTRMAGGPAMLADVLGQQARRPQLLRVPQLLGLLAGQRHHPSPCFGGQSRASAAPRQVLQRPACAQF
jgi:hypothetical protein